MRKAVVAVMDSPLPLLVILVTQVLLVAIGFPLGTISTVCFAFAGFMAGWGLRGACVRGEEPSALAVENRK